MGLEVLSDLSELLPYPIPNFPLFAGIGTLGTFNQYTVSCHFHADFEFNLVLEGGMDYFVNGTNVHLSEGDGIFVNSRRLHYNYSRDRSPCRYLVITISPELFPTELPAVKRLMEAKTDMRCSDFLPLKKDEYQSALALYPKLLHEVRQNNANPLRTLSLVAALCGEVVPHIETGARSDERDAKWMSVYDMTNYIHAHYRETVSLSDVANAGKVCRSRCCQLFTAYMGQSPIEYLIAYRLQKGRDILVSSKCPVSETAMKCGFSGQSYFTQMFKRVYGVAPREYRVLNCRQ